MDDHYRSPLEQKFTDLPEPPAPPEALRTVDDEIDDVYLAGLEAYIAKLGEHIRTIQNEETARMQRFSKQLEKLKTKSSKRREDAEEDARDEFQQTISAIRRKRKHYREMERDALLERRKYLESMAVYKQEQDQLREQLQRIGIIQEPQQSSTTVGSVVGPFAMVFFVLQVALILTYLATNFPTYTTSETDQYELDNLGAPLRIDNYYTFFVHIAVMVFFGYGLLAIWLKKYCFSSISYSFMIAAFAFEFNFFMNGLWKNIAAEDWVEIPMTLQTLIESIYGSVAVLVTFGAVLGKITPIELLVMAFLEIVAYSFNYYLCIFILDAMDPGGGMMIHLFGAVFSIGVSLSLSEGFRVNKDKGAKNQSSSYRSDVFSLFGTILLFVFYPSFNAALAPNGTQQRAAINTIIALLASCVFAFLVSRTFRRKYFSVRDVQSATIAGGIAIGSAHSIIIVPGAALLVGAVAATTTVIGHVWLTPFLERSTEYRISDTRGTISLHGLSGLIAGIGSIVATGVADFNIYGQPSTELFEHGVPDQAGYQAAALFITLGVAAVTGGLVGSALYVVRKITIGKRVPVPFSDEEEFFVPTEFESVMIKLRTAA